MVCLSGSGVWRLGVRRGGDGIPGEAVDKDRCADGHVST